MSDEPESEREKAIQRREYFGFDFDFEHYKVFRVFLTGQRLQIQNQTNLNPTGRPQQIQNQSNLNLNRFFRAKGKVSKATGKEKKLISSCTKCSSCIRSHQTRIPSDNSHFGTPSNTNT